MQTFNSGTSAFRSFSAIFGGAIRRAAKLSSRSPIEMVVAVLILASFCYFYLFNLARTSDIFTGTVTRLYPTSAYASADAAHFTQLDRAAAVPNEAVKVYLKQLMVSATGSNKDDPSKNVLDHATLVSTLQLQHTVENDIYVPDTASNRYAYNDDLCYKVKDDQCFRQSPLDVAHQGDAAMPSINDERAQAVFGDLNLDKQYARSIVISYAFNASSTYRQHLADLWEHKVATLAPGDLVSISNTGNQENVFSWLFIIARNVVIRVKELIDVSTFIWIL